MTARTVGALALTRRRLQEACTAGCGVREGGPQSHVSLNSLQLESGDEILRCLP